MAHFPFRIFFLRHVVTALGIDKIPFNEVHFVYMKSGRGADNVEKKTVKKLRLFYLKRSWLRLRIKGTTGKRRAYPAVKQGEVGRRNCWTVT